MNRENLKAMADFIEKVPQKGFNMDQFRESRDHLNPICGSVGCVVGYCTALDAETVRRKFMKNEESIDFFGWSEYFTEISHSSQEWGYLFGQEWQDIDNTPTGAAKRIRWVLKNGFPEEIGLELEMWEEPQYLKE